MKLKGNSTRETQETIPLCRKPDGNEGIYKFVLEV